MLETIDLNKSLSKATYSKRMKELQEQLRRLQYDAKQAELPVVICLEGWDSSGKGTIIKKLTERLDPRLFKVHPGTPPSTLERHHHFLWRYQVELPNDGEMGIFDHSWYSRVLVERCDKVAKKKQWREAYQQINEFERLLTDDGTVIVKLWLQISKKEQAKRFRVALKSPLTKWKITKEYKRHHREYKKWTKAVEEMLAKTGCPAAPWSIIEATDLHWARVCVFETLVKRIEDALKFRRENPMAVSRTQAAVAARRLAHAKRADAEHDLAKAEEKASMNQPSEEMSHA